MCKSPTIFFNYVEATKLNQCYKKNMGPGSRPSPSASCGNAKQKTTQPLAFINLFGFALASRRSPGQPLKLANDNVTVCKPMPLALPLKRTPRERHHATQAARRSNMLRAAFAWPQTRQPLACTCSMLPFLAERFRAPFVKSARAFWATLVQVVNP